MNISRRLNSLPLFWKVNAFIVTLLIAVVAMAEGVFEPLAKKLLAGMHLGFRPWHETAIWAATILTPSLACGYVLSKILSVKLEKMARVSKALACGNLEFRLPVTGNDKDAFDVLARSLNEMAAAIETQISNERRLLADISHELRSPLTRMTIATELLKRRHNGKGPDILLRLEKELTHMNELVSLLLTQARDKLSTSGLAGPVHLGQMLAELAADFSFQGEAQEKAVQADIGEDLIVYGNPLLLQRMLGNLLSNAVFYTPAHSIVSISAGRIGNEVAIAIRDFGPGVPAEHLDAIFRAFYRVDSSRARSSGGVGLGLALAREAVIAHRGDIRAENASPGLRVTVRLPVHSGTRSIAL